MLLLFVAGLQSHVVTTMFPFVVEMCIFFCDGNDDGIERFFFVLVSEQDTDNKIVQINI
jgi:hypothetical protein